MNDLEYMYILKENGYEPTFENLTILKEGLDSGELFTEAIRLGGLAKNGGNNLFRKYSEKDITVAGLVDDYMTYKNLDGNFTKIRTNIRAFLRAAARDDKRCEEIRSKMMEEIAKPDQNKSKVDSLRNAYFAALDRLYTKEVKEERASKNTKYVVKESVINEDETALGMFSKKTPSITDEKYYDYYKIANPSTHTIKTYSTLNYNKYNAAMREFNDEMDMLQGLENGICALAAIAVICGVVGGAKLLHKILQDRRAKAFLKDKKQKRVFEIVFNRANKDPEIKKLKDRAKELMDNEDGPSKTELKDLISATRAKLKHIEKQVRIDIIDDNEHKNIDESYTNYELYKILENSGFKTTEINLEILKNGLTENDYIIIDGIIL